MLKLLPRSKYTGHTKPLEEIGTGISFLSLFGGLPNGASVLQLWNFSIGDLIDSGIIDSNELFDNLIECFFKLLVFLLSSPTKTPTHPACHRGRFAYPSTR
jgi:hypothetical protein